MTLIRLKTRHFRTQKNILYHGRIQGGGPGGPDPPPPKYQTPSNLTSEEIRVCLTQF